MGSLPRARLSTAVLFLYLAYRLAGRDTEELDALPPLLAQIIEATDDAARLIAACLDGRDDMHYLRYGLTHPIALEGALELTEITYAQCERIFSSEFKHGLLSLVHDGYPVVFITAPGEMMINHVNEVSTRGGRSIAVAVEHPPLRATVHNHLLALDAERFLSPILATMPAQLVAYYPSVAPRIDPDFPAI